ncbi:leucine-rich repeat receptor-like protein kinase PXL1 [Prunus yedoensis var. nudiflora]|uniref:Leucine-rich repeat receptor-like protein kinase PXL1 n=1 Tax=Prunus yedoensis var. nudiflora TaxID=2094558 RepID=A0A314UVL0_PRUYE|nr:leucine-rich repeat receptor-like protein kinase PXL1 [Prunus yedoensis var. nudiflora]
MQACPGRNASRPPNRTSLYCKAPQRQAIHERYHTMLGEAKPRRKSIWSRGQKTGTEKPIFSTSPVMGLL